LEEDGMKGGDERAGMRHGEGHGHISRQISMIEWIIGKDDTARNTRFACVKEEASREASTTPPGAHCWA
jgi:hypothetical protein